MRLSAEFSQYFADRMVQILEKFCLERQLLPDDETLHSRRFLKRSILPHVQRLSEIFNRQNTVDPSSLEHQAYWSGSSNPKNCRLAYLLTYLPCHALRMASVWQELFSLGYVFHKNELSALELGAGPGTASLGSLLAQSFAHELKINWNLVDQDKTSLEWGQNLLQNQGQSVRTLRHKIKFAEDSKAKYGISPLPGPLHKKKFDLIISSYFLNELQNKPLELAQGLIKIWQENLNPDGMMILVEPALKHQSRKLLAIRQCLIEDLQREKDFRVLLPCLGLQTCGALQDPEDWCHEEVKWQRPAYLQQLDQMARLDHRSLPFSYLVIMKSKRQLAGILPALGQDSKSCHRLVSPSYQQGPDLEFFVCGNSKETGGKGKARYRAKKGFLRRGDVFVDAKIRGDSQAQRIDSADKILGPEHSSDQND